MMRTTKALKAQRNGVRLFGKNFWSPEIIEHQGKQVYARYNPDSIDTLYIYNASDDIFICEVYNNELKGSSSDDYRELNSRKKAVKKLVQEYKCDIADITENADDIELCLTHNDSIMWKVCCFCIEAQCSYLLVPSKLL